MNEKGKMLDPNNCNSQPPVVRITELSQTNAEEVQGRDDKSFFVE